MTRLTLNAKLENKKIKLCKPNQKKLTLNTKLENKKIKLCKPNQKKLTLNTKLENKKSGFSQTAFSKIRSRT